MVKLRRDRIQGDTNIIVALNLLHDEIENWIRWCKSGKPIAPGHADSVLGKLYVQRDREAQPKQPRIDIDIFQAEAFEDALNDLPHNEKLAFRLHVYGVAFVRGKVKRARSKLHASKIMRVAEKTFRRYVSSALSTLAKRFGKVATDTVHFEKYTK